MTQPTPVFGRLVTAMVTPFKADGGVDFEAARKLAAYLVDEQGNDALVVNGTTGEAPTTSDLEKNALVEAVAAEVGDRAKVIAGVGTFDTQHSVHLARDAESAGADGLLVVTPYYSLPPQDALVAHFQAVADATSLPNILYDIPHRSGRPIEAASLVKLAAHPNIAGVKDAKKDLVSSARVIAETGLAYYAGDDAITLPLLAVGGVGLVGTSTHLSGAKAKEMILAFVAGDVARAVEVFREVLPVFTGVFATQGCMLVKAGLEHKHLLPNRLVRQPLLAASEAEKAAFVALLEAAGL
jgi:4-hydroxy-tetrahydrodipicolinate synthase